MDIFQIPESNVLELSSLSRNLMISRWPPDAAACINVFPVASCRHQSAPSSWYSSFNTSKCPFSAARYAGQSPTLLYKHILIFYLIISRFLIFCVQYPTKFIKHAFIKWLSPTGPLFFAIILSASHLDKPQWAPGLQLHLIALPGLYTEPISDPIFPDDPGSLATPACSDPGSRSVTQGHREKWVQKSCVSFEEEYNI